MEKKMGLILGAVFFSGMILTSVAPAASPEDEKYMWTVTAKCTNNLKSVTEKHCGKKGDAVAKVKGQLRRERGCGEIQVVSAEKGEKCN